MLFKPGEQPVVPYTANPKKDIEWPDSRNMEKPMLKRPLYIDRNGILYSKYFCYISPDPQIRVATEEEIFKGQYWGVLPDPAKSCKGQL